MGSLADFLVGIEGYADFPVLDFGMVLKIDYRRDYFGDARLVVGAEQGCAVGDNQVLSHVIEQFGEFSRSQYNPLLLVEDNVLAVIAADNAGFHVMARHIGGGVQVGYEAYHRHVLAVGIGRKGRHQVTVLVEGNLLETEFPEFFFKRLGEFELPRGGGGEIGEFVALGVELHISEKSINNVHRQKDMFNTCKVSIFSAKSRKMGDFSCGDEPSASPGGLQRKKSKIMKTLLDKLRGLLGASGSSPAPRLQPVPVRVRVR